MGTLARNGLKLQNRAIYFKTNAEAYLEPSQISKMELFAKIMTKTS